MLFNLQKCLLTFSHLQIKVTQSQWWVLDIFLNFRGFGQSFGHKKKCPKPVQNCPKLVQNYSGLSNCPTLPMRAQVVFALNTKPSVYIFKSVISAINRISFEEGWVECGVLRNWWCEMVVSDVHLFLFRSLYELMQRIWRALGSLYGLY